MLRADMEAARCGTNSTKTIAPLAQTLAPQASTSLLPAKRSGIACRLLSSTVPVRPFCDPSPAARTVLASLRRLKDYGFAIRP